MNQNPVGVIPARMQIDTPHTAHRKLFEHVRAAHEDVLVCLGVPRVYADDRDPLSYEVRKEMVLSEFPGVTVAPIKDVGNPPVWSKHLDALMEQQYPGRRFVLYGSRDSFISSYSGKYPTISLPSIKGVSATEIRALVAANPINSDDFRRGIIHAHAVRKSITYQTVDLAILSEDKKHVLIGWRDIEEGKCRFPGGFLDPEDASFEIAVCREGREEVPKVRIKDLRYLASMRPDDLRYRGRKDSVMTVLFTAIYDGGVVEAGDDLDGVDWFPVDNFIDILVDAHKPLGEAVLRRIRGS